jgi:pimeloyl-ACP methyl ester carboxylesterase
VDPSQVPPAELPGLVYAHAARFAHLADPQPNSRASSRAHAVWQTNQETLKCYAGQPFFCDPSLPERLATIRVPVMIIWGEADRIVTPAYGRVLASSIPTARFELLADAGHFPQIEQPDRVAALVRGWQTISADG